MNPSKEDLSKLIETCWNASQEANLKGYLAGQCAVGSVDLIRFKTFEILLTCLCPRATQQVEHGSSPSKEPWQE